MSVAIGTGLAIAGIGASVGTGLYGAHKAGQAADAQVASADKAAQLQKQAADEQLAFQKQQYADTQQREAPYQQAGTQALGKLSDMPAFQAPGSDFTTDPGYQFRLQEGNKSIERSAAARGSVLNPATAKALDRFNQDTASAEYGNVYGRRFGEYNNNLNQLQSLAGTGQTANAALNASGANTANSMSSILGTSAANQGQYAQNAGAARASGYINSANAISGGIAGGFNNASQLYTLSEILKRQKQQDSINV